MKKLQIGQAYKFLKRDFKNTTSVYEAEMFDYTLENENVYPAIKMIDHFSLKCPVVFTVVDICPHFALAYDKSYFCYKILVGDKIYTKFIHTDKENFVEEVC